MSGLANMTLFLLLVNYIAALASVQLMRGDIASSQPMNFGQLFTAFLAIYQICSSENWTNVLYEATAAEIPLGQTVVVATFISCWLLFANCKPPTPLINTLLTGGTVIVIQMFIAVINENFQIAEEAKKGEQASNYWATYQAETEKAPWIRKLNPYRWVKANPVKVKVENLPSNLVLPIQKALVQDYAMPRQDQRSAPVSSLLSKTH
jgi:voltage-dependent calcium channel